MNDWSEEEQQLFVLDHLKILGQYLPGDTTLNQLRVIQYIRLKCVNGGTGTTHTEICQDLELNGATVTRALTRFLAGHLINQQSSPEDGRQRFLVMGTQISQSATFIGKIKALAAIHFNRI
jgi:DNA-binding MarR family transcriptional regulator